jgi:hypothetical protein
LWYLDAVFGEPRGDQLGIRFGEVGDALVSCDAEFYEASDYLSPLLLVLVEKTEVAGFAWTAERSS